MIVKEILPLLPKFSDDSGYDVQCIVWDKKKPLAYYEKETNIKEFLDYEIIAIKSGVLRFGGNYDEQLCLVLAEKEIDILRRKQKEYDMQQYYKKLEEHKHVKY